MKRGGDRRLILKPRNFKREIEAQQLGQQNVCLEYCNNRSFQLRFALYPIFINCTFNSRLQLLFGKHWNTILRRIPDQSRPLSTTEDENEIWKIACIKPF